VTTRAAARRLATVGPDVRGLRAWEQTTLEAPGRPPITVTATPARHGPPLSRPIVGAVTGFALQWPGQEHGALWITGDTVLSRAVRRVPSRLPIDTVILHVGGVRFPITGPLRYTLTAGRAAELCALAAPRTIIPVHYEGWEHFRDGRAAIERAFAAAPGGLGDRLHWLPLAADGRRDG
jgi:L-ascorbate metabolism protein UlaG (beta-lactamase superfamily)